MTEPNPSYTATYQDVEIVAATPDPDTFSRYLEHRRRCLIMELRQIDKTLGRPQTIPNRLDKE